MTRPQIIRADTIDLQDHQSPSAQDHSRHPYRANPQSKHLSPHQADALRNAEEEAAEEQQNSPRLSWANGDGLQPEEDQFDGVLNRLMQGQTGDERHEPEGDRHGDVPSLGSSLGEETDMADIEGDDGLDDDDLMDKISSSPSIDDEDIDFEFVYALHTFTATVEGQANASKGDTMVLLDDSNSYWWLVRVVKDSSIGYLPAEHIETPTERLARLNKHRNIDLSATMLGDNPDRSINPLKKAMRRRNAKTVQFIGNTYYEASDNDYSSEEEDQDQDVQQDGGEGASAEDQQGETEERDEIKAVEPPQAKSQGTDTAEDKIEPVEPPSIAKTTGDAPSQEGSTSKEDVSDRQADAIIKTRNGVVRNTDSFFKDDNVETRKITLTPNLLRDDSSASMVRSDLRELRAKGSLEILEKSSASDKSKEDKKKRDKKPGMLSGLFKRKDKRSKNHDDDTEDPLYHEKHSGESSRSSPVPKGSEESLRTEVQNQQQPQSANKEQPNKLQKRARSDSGPKEQKTSPRPAPVQKPLQQTTPPDRPAPSAPDALRSIHSAGHAAGAKNPSEQDLSPPGSSSGPRREHTPAIAEMRSGEGPRSSPPSSSEPASIPMFNEESRPEERQAQEEPRKEPEQPSRPAPEARREQPADEAMDDSVNEFGPRTIDRLSESPVHITAEGAARPQQSGLVNDSSSQDTADLAPSPPSSPEMVDAPETHELKAADEDMREHTPVSSTATPTWSDASLRTYLENDNDIKDLLIVVHDKSGVVPAGPDHPVVGGLFKSEQAKLAEITTRLDNLLGDWLSRRSKGTAP